MFRQLSDKDCAVTVLAHATGIPYTQVVNSIPEFRYLRARRRLKREKTDQIIGRRKRPDSQTRITRRGDYDDRYRVYRFPYFCGFGLSNKEEKNLLDRLGINYIERGNCSLEMLRHVPYALLSVPSLNVKTSAHLLLWDRGQIWDPSPKKRYNYLKLRRAAWIHCLALATDDAEFDHLRMVLRTGLHGREIVTMLTWKIMNLMKKEENEEVAASQVVTWWQTSGQVVPPKVNHLIMERIDEL